MAVEQDKAGGQGDLQRGDTVSCAAVSNMKRCRNGSLPALAVAASPGRCLCPARMVNYVTSADGAACRAHVN
jgi:hypothetical protein